MTGLLKHLILSIPQEWIIDGRLACDKGTGKEWEFCFQRVLAANKNQRSVAALRRAGKEGEYIFPEGVGSTTHLLNILDS